MNAVSVGPMGEKKRNGAVEPTDRPQVSTAEVVRPQQTGHERRAAYCEPKHKAEQRRQRIGVSRKQKAHRQQQQAR